MEARAEARNKFADMISQSHWKERCETVQNLDAFIMHLIHDEQEEQERRFAEEHHLAEWLFPHYYTDEEGEILKQFAQMASERRTAVYGTGAVARLLLNCGFYGQVAGVMAAGRAEKNFCGKSLMDESQVLEARVSQIIVAAKTINYPVITGRISGFCEKNGILLRGLNGRNLVKWFDSNTIKNSKKDRRYLELHSEILKKEICRHDVISFDVFDTLVMRKVLKPSDIFYLVGQQAEGLGLTPESFAERRQYAEHHNIYEKNIFGIYHMLQDLLVLTDRQRDHLMELEIGIEEQLLVPRQEIMEIFQVAISHKKPVYLISDMYLPESVLEKLLFKLGIKGYEKLLVSCDYHCGKTSGLAQIYKQTVIGKSCLHIGDNEIADGDAFAKEGIDTFIIHSALRLSQLTSFQSLQEYAYTKDEQNALGLLYAKFLNSPFALNQGRGLVQTGTYREWGYLFLGVYITAYFDWLCREIRKNKIEKMLFSTRDGYIFYRIYCWYRENVDGSLPEAVYFKTSRKICYIASLAEEENIDFFLGYDDVYCPEELLNKRFLLEKEEISPCPDGMGRREYVMMHKEIIYRKAETVRKQYLAYMEGLGLHEGAEYGFFDSYCRGTVQFLLEQFVPFKLCGLYLGKIYQTRKLNKVLSFYKDRGNYLRMDDVNEKRTLLEYCLSSPETNIIGMDAEGNFRYAKEYRAPRDIEHMMEIQRGAEDFFVEYYSAFHTGGDGFGTDLPNAVIHLTDQVELTGECSDMGKIRSIDDMTDRGYAVLET